MNSTKTIQAPELGGSTTVKLDNTDLTLAGPSGTLHRKFHTDVGAQLFYDKITDNVDLETLKFFGFVVEING
jgi:hypothetical protein